MKTLENYEKIERIYGILCELDERRWEWHANLPDKGAVRDSEVNRWLEYYSEAGDTEVVDYDPEEEDEECYVNDYERLAYFSWKLVNNHRFKKKFLKSIAFFQGCVWFESKTEFQEILKKLGQAIKDR